MSICNLNPLNSLQEKGLFVRILGESSEPNTLIVECSIYVTDHDDETGVTTILEIPDGPVKENGRCVACDCLVESYTTTPIALKKGCIQCPLGCGGVTKPWALRERKYHGIFKLGKSVQKVAWEPFSLKVGPMPSAIVQEICEALLGAKAC